MDDYNLLSYRLATVEDCDTLSVLINNSFRNDFECQGWTNANQIMDGLRTNSQTLYNIINESNSVILVFFDKIEQILIGCVQLEYKSEMKIAFMEMLVVRPDLQTRGYGKFIISVAEQYSKNKWNVDYIQLSVVIQRPELVNYYKRRGYIDTGERQSCHAYAFCQLKRDDYELCIMRKYLKTNEDKIST